MAAECAVERQDSMCAEAGGEKLIPEYGRRACCRHESPQTGTRRELPSQPEGASAAVPRIYWSRIYCAGGETWATVKAGRKSAKSGAMPEREAGGRGSNSTFRGGEGKGPPRRSFSEMFTSASSKRAEDLLSESAPRTRSFGTTAGEMRLDLRRL